ncbi:Rv1355c family protein [Parapedobacter koreensis]|uniref:ThiF family protein n=1 Tax=Parapedobacter koreensis TaxID=332977 RepID=A0A1H7RG96_9SPHI|nr:Rv1355c family protein [Parapedobacter koreensis]SEL59038.1 ThiF family protein [Parapedobacter koreensis]
MSKQDETSGVSNAMHTYRPSFFRTQYTEDRVKLESLRSGGGMVFESDEIKRQLKELVRCRYPSGQLSEVEYDFHIHELLAGRSMTEYGVWVYYPWRKTLVHLLDEAEFIEVRTNRNQYKITQAERDTLATKKLGIVGLSVGQSIALTIAMERICGELRLADFDELDLSNLNRIRSGVFNLSVPKVIIAAREIAEIDPYLEVSIFPSGLNTTNYTSFFTDGGQLDLLIEVCDSFEVKIESRFKARELGIPVVMDTNDRGMLDIERFDLNPDRPILHGLADDLTPEKLRELSEIERLKYLMKIVDADKLSERMKRSIPEIKRTISSWPQLASAVVLGGAITTDVCRRILLNEFTSSGRYYMDMEQYIA